MKNKKGFTPVIVLSFWALTGAVALACIWHIPAWTKAKENHTEAIYQSTIMIPAHSKPVILSVSNGNGGNFTGGNSGPIAE